MIILSIGTAVYAQSLPIPSELYGTYAPQGNCQQAPRVMVNQHGAFIHSNGVQTGPLSVDVCLTCAGGARYSGIERWLFVQSGKTAPLTLRFNADEKPGHLAIDENDSHHIPLTGPLLSIFKASPLERCTVTANSPVRKPAQSTAKNTASQPAAKSFAQLINTLMIPTTMPAESFYDWRSLDQKAAIQWQPLPPQMLDKPLMGGHYFKRNGTAKVGTQSFKMFAAGARTMAMAYHFKNEGAPLGETNLLSALTQSGFTLKQARCPLQPNPNVPRWYRLTHSGKRTALLWVIPASSNREHWEGFNLNLTDTLPPLTPAEQSIYTNQCP